MRQCATSRSLTCVRSYSPSGTGYVHRTRSPDSARVQDASPHRSASTLHHLGFTGRIRRSASPRVRFRYSVVGRLFVAPLVFTSMNSNEKIAVALFLSSPSQFTGQRVHSPSMRCLRKPQWWMRRGSYARQGSNGLDPSDIGRRLQGRRRAMWVQIKPGLRGHLRIVIQLFCPVAKWFAGRNPSVIGHLMRGTADSDARHDPVAVTSQHADTADSSSIRWL